MKRETLIDRCREDAKRDPWLVLGIGIALGWILACLILGGDALDDRVNSPAYATEVAAK